MLKYYPIDSGLGWVVVTPGREDRGKSLECATHRTRRRRYGGGVAGAVDAGLRQRCSARRKSRSRAC